MRSMVIGNDTKYQPHPARASSGIRYRYGQQGYRAGDQADSTTVPTITVVAQLLLFPHTSSNRRPAIHREPQTGTGAPTLAAINNVGGPVTFRSIKDTDSRSE